MNPSENLTACTLETPDGPFTLVVADNGAVVAAGWSADPDVVARRAGGGGDLIVADANNPGPAAPAVRAVRAYYEGDLDAPLRVPVAAQGAGFASEVRRVLREIPAGQVRRYGEVAAALGNPRASRAVGAACGANAPALFAPCHRVVGAAGALTGFAWGVDIKRSLLAREGALVCP